MALCSTTNYHIVAGRPIWELPDIIKEWTVVSTIRRHTIAPCSIISFDKFLVVLYLCLFMGRGLYAPKVLARCFAALYMTGNHQTMQALVACTRTGRPHTYLLTYLHCKRRIVEALALMSKLKLELELELDLDLDLELENLSSRYPRLHSIWVSS